MQRSQQLAVMFLLGAFLVGGTLGFTMDRMMGGSTNGPSGSLDSFAIELELSATQRAAIDSLLDERHRIIDSITAPMRPSIEAVRENTRQQIANRLNERQQGKYTAFLERMRREAEHK